MYEKDNIRHRCRYKYKYDIQIKSYQISIFMISIHSIVWYIGIIWEHSKNMNSHSLKLVKYLLWFVHIWIVCARIIYTNSRLQFLKESHKNESLLLTQNPLCTVAQYPSLHSTSWILNIAYFLPELKNIYIPYKKDVPVLFYNVVYMLFQCTKIAKQ